MSRKIHLDHATLWDIAKAIAPLGPRDHGEHKNRYGSITAAVREAVEARGEKLQMQSADRQVVWEMIKQIKRAKSA